jgi:hypothetical protein
VRTPRDTPILVLAYNRPSLVQELFERLQDLRATRVYIAVDGPKPDSSDDQARVLQVRELARSINWADETHYLLQEENLGCGSAVKTALDWFFSHEAEGIILEDDILPGEFFIPFCTQLLSRYRHDERVFAISGYDPVPRDCLTSPHDTYRFSAITQVWGWATWARSWRRYTYNLQFWKRQFPFRQRWNSMERNPAITAYWSSCFNLVADGRLDTWDYQLAFTQLLSGQATAVSTYSLVENRGFGSDATHTQVAPIHVHIEPGPSQDSFVPMGIDHSADLWMYRNFFGVSARTAMARALERLLWKAGLEHQGNQMRVHN